MQAALCEAFLVTINMKNPGGNFSANDKLTQPKVGLTPQTVLRRLPELKLRLTSNNELEISLPGQEITCGSHGLAILDLFATPTTIRAAVEQLRLRLTGGQDCVDQWHTILELYKFGVLQDDTCVDATLPVESAGFDSLDIHVRMLNDRTRTAQYLAAIKEIVRPDDIVVDIGTGTGILAMAAAQAGARHVYAIEVGQIGQIARELFAANGFSERITLLPGWSTQITLPERADVMVSEIIGNEPLGERVLEVTADARQRLLKTDARLLPQRLEIYGLAVDVPVAELKTHSVTGGALRDWANWYDFDFSQLAKSARKQPTVFSPRPYKARHWPALSEPLRLAEIDFQAKIPQVMEQNIRFTIATEGRFNGLLLYFDLALSATIQLTTSPTDAPCECHWRNQVWLLPEAFQAVVGDEFRVTYRHGVAGKERVTVARA